MCIRSEREHDTVRSPFPAPALALGDLEAAERAGEGQEEGAGLTRAAVGLGENAEASVG